MKTIIFALLFMTLFAQERRTLYDNGDPIEGEFISLEFNDEAQEAYALQFNVENNSMLTYIILRLAYEGEAPEANVRLQSSSNNQPDSCIFEWNFSLDPYNPDGRAYILNFLGECIQLAGDTQYWMSLTPNEQGSNIRWQVPTTLPMFTVSESNNGGQDWSSFTGIPGCLGVFGDELLEFAHYGGDVNFDGNRNVQDIVMIVAHLMEQAIFNNDQLIEAEMNDDDVVDVLDIIALINRILYEGSPLPDFAYEDLNPNSSTFGQAIGPSYFAGMHSFYYWGKAG